MAIFILWKNSFLYCISFSYYEAYNRNLFEGHGDNMKQEKGLMIEGTIWKQLLLFSLPLLLGNLFQQLYNTVDSIIVGNYVGSEALAAVNSSNPIINLLVSFFMGISVGAGVVISRYFGSRNHEGLEKAVHTTIAFAFVAGIVMTFVGVICAPWILRAVGTPDSVMENSILYLRIYFAGILGVMIYNMGSGVLRAVGDSKNPLYFLIISSLVNIVLDLVFVVVLHMGIAGVAWATLIAQAVSALLTMWLLVKSKMEYRVVLRRIRFDFPMLKDIIKVGLPSGIQNAIVSFSNVIVQSNINSFGPMAMAGCGSYSKIDGFAILPVMSFSMALTTFVGQNMGAQRYDRVKQGAKIGMIMSCCITFGLGTMLFIFAPQILQIFSNEQEVIYYGTLMMRTVVPGYLFLAVSHALAGVIRGAGLTKIPMIVMVCCWCFLRMAWIFAAMPIFQDIQVVFWGYPITWIASCICMYLYYRKADWMRIR